MKAIRNIFVYGILLTGIIAGLSVPALGQNSAKAEERGKTEVVRKKGGDTKTAAKATQSRGQKGRQAAAERQDEKQKTPANRDRQVDNERRGNTGSQGDTRRGQDQNNRGNDRGNNNRQGNRGNDRGNNNRQGNHGNDRGNNNRQGNHGNDRGNNNRQGNHDNDRRYTDRNHNRGNDHDRHNGYDRRHHDRNNVRYRHRVPDRTVYPRYSGRMPRQYYNHPYWRKYHRPRKQFYVSFGWSPFFVLDLTPRVRFTTYLRPVIYSRSHIVFTREYDRYDYRPGDPIGYTVVIDFDGMTRIYDNYYERSPELAEQFYMSSYRLGRLEHIVKRGRYYDDVRCLYDEYGQDEHPGFATIGYRRTPSSPMRSLSLNLNAPQHLQPDYFLDFMQEMDDLLYDD